MAKNTKPAVSQLRAALYDVDQEFSQAREFLRDAYDIDDLTLIELVHLRRLAEDATRRANTAHVERHEPWELFSPRHDAAYRWLNDLYGVHVAHVLERIRVIDRTTGEEFLVLWPTFAAGKPSLQVRAHFERLMERKDKLGHDVTIEFDGLGQPFKDYLWLLRQRAHQP